MKPALRCIRRRRSVLAAMLLVSTSACWTRLGDEPAGKMEADGSSSEASTASEGSTMSEDGAETASEETEGGTEDEGGMHPSGCDAPCDIWDPLGCPAGQKCVSQACGLSFAPDTTVCVDVYDDAMLDEPCEPFENGAGYQGGDTCGPDLICVFPSEQNPFGGVCKRPCRGTPDDPQCPEGQACLHYLFPSKLVDDVESPESGASPVCLRTCDPIAQDCGEGEACIPNELPQIGWPHDEPGNSEHAEFVCAPFRSSSDDGCDSHWSCGPDRLCDSACAWGPLACCTTSFCDLDAPVCHLKICKPIYSPPTPGHENVGVCIPPDMPEPGP